MGKADLIFRIKELSAYSKTKQEIFNLLENQISEGQKGWLAKKILSFPSPSLVKKYKPNNHFLALILIVQCYFAILMFIDSDIESSTYKYFASVSAFFIYLILILGVFKCRLYVYNTLLFLCVLNIVIGSFNIFTPFWVETLISNSINVIQILYISWLRKKMFPEISYRTITSPWQSDKYIIR